MSRPRRLSWVRLDDLAAAEDHRPWMSSFGVGDDGSTWMSINNLDPADQFRAAMDDLLILGPHGYYVDLLVVSLRFATSDRDHEILEWLDRCAREACDGRFLSP